MSTSYISAESLGRLVEVLETRGYTVVGPTLRDGAVLYGELDSAADFPIGWRDEQEAGRYRLHKRGDDTVFGCVVGPQSCKTQLFPPVQRLWAAEREGATRPWITISEPTPGSRFAFVGIRSCDLAALAVHDKVLRDGPYSDPRYADRREDSFTVAVHCTEPGGTCFCASMVTGPRAESGFDLALTELFLNGDHGFVVEVGTASGASVLDELQWREASPEEIRAAERAVEEAASRMGRKIDTDGLKAMLYESYDDPRWDEVAGRCLACANCTMVCPTCFCSTVVDATDLTGNGAERVRQWDSCFTGDHSYIHGGSMRISTRSRYRQWLTHKLATWIDQFGVPGCVGCGRCITWCPVGIDITEEVRLLRDNRDADGRGSGSSEEES